MDRNNPFFPEWEEEYYLVYTAKKHGKWVMLKTLKPEYAREPAFCDMIEKSLKCAIIWRIQTL